MIATVLLAAAIRLAGVTGEDLTARAYFDVNNAKVGDPLVLTIDFIGSADFQALHPPALSKAVDRTQWKVDDASAKTETDTRRVGGFFSSREVAVARSLVYRVRPLKEGVIWFPALEFEYEGNDGTVRTIVANEIPVHAKPGEQVEVKEIGEDFEKMPEPPALVAEPGVELDDDRMFAWRKACANPSADAFKDFEFPAGRMNEATCAIREGQWRRAVKVYSRLEWSVGQTPEIERGLVAALALKHGNAAAELPVWRVVARPVLRFALAGRLGVIFGGLAAVVLLFLLVGRAIKALACLAAVLFLVPAAEAQFSLFGNMPQADPPEIKASFRTEPTELQVGQQFAFIVAIEAPKTVSVGQIQLQPSEMFGLTVVGRVQNLTDGVSANPSNVVKRLSVPVRYDVPFQGPLSFTVLGQVSGRQEKSSAHGTMSFTFSNGFQARTSPVQLDIKPLPTAGQPEDFSGIIAESLSMTERTDLATVETNDVIQITYHLEYRGYLPKDWRPDGVAFEIGRAARNEVSAIEWRRYHVADGAPETPHGEICYFDPKEKAYKRLKYGGRHVGYK